MSVLGLAYLFIYLTVVVLVILTLLLLIGGDVRDTSQLWLDSGRYHVIGALCVFILIDCFTCPAMLSFMPYPVK